MTIFTALTLVAATVMELSHRELWSEWFPESFSPHYSQVSYLIEEEGRVDALEKLNLAKTALSGYVIVFALVFRIS